EVVDEADAARVAEVDPPFAVPGPGVAERGEHDLRVRAHDLLEMDHAVLVRGEDDAPVQDVPVPGEGVLALLAAAGVRVLRRVGPGAAVVALRAADLALVARVLDR